MSDIQLLTIGLTLLAIFGATVANRKSVEDMRDVLRAENKAQASELTAAFKTQAAEFTAALKVQSAELNAALIRIENKIDHVAEMVASHSERLDKLEGGRA